MIRRQNSIRELLRQHGSSHAVYLVLRARVDAGHGLLMDQWDWFDSMEKQFEPERSAKRWADARRRNNMRAARELSEADLREVLAEKLTPEPQRDGGE